MRSSMARPPATTSAPPPPPDYHPDYIARRDQLAALAAGSGAPPADIEYSDVENRTWSTVIAALHERWERVAAPEILAAARRLGLPSGRVPQLREVTDALRPRTGFEFRAVPGLVPVDEFFGALAEGRFLSTQYIRHHESPLYTPEPDIIHEVIGHGTCLAQPHLAMVHREAGGAMLRMETEAARQFVADVFWFSIEFGVVRTSEGPRAHGAGLLSSVGELDWYIDHAEIRPADITEMGTVRYDISTYQPVLFGETSLAQLVDTVGEFFATATTDSVIGLAHQACIG
ncbi:MAG: phenylalanine 4-monooxygenase [Actinomycetota bacterium]